MQLTVMEDFKSLTVWHEVLLTEFWESRWFRDDSGEIFCYLNAICLASWCVGFYVLLFSFF